MKKIKALTVSIFILSIACLLSLTGCAEKAPIEDNSGSENTSDTVITESTVSDSESEPADMTASTADEEAVPDVVDVDEPIDEETTALANEIIDGLHDDLVIAVEILNLNIMEPSSYSDGVDKYGNLIKDEDGWYIRMQPEYNTVEEIEEAMHKVFSNRKCDDISSIYSSEDSTTFKMFDGELYCIEGDKPYSFFKLPVDSAVRISEDEILAKTTVNYDDGDYPYEITLVKEDDVWKIDKLTEDGREVNY